MWFYFDHCERLVDCFVCLIEIVREFGALTNRKWSNQLKKKKKKKTLKRWTSQPGLNTTGALCVIYRLCYNTPESELWLWLAEHSLYTSWFAYTEWMMTCTLYVHEKAWLRLRLIDSSIVWRGFTSFPGAHCDPRHYDHGGSASISGCWLRINPSLQCPGCPQGSPTSLTLLPPQHTPMPFNGSTFY